MLKRTIATASFLAFFAIPATAEILSTEFRKDATSLNLSVIGTKDWAVFGLGNREKNALLWTATDSKKGGRGISRTMSTSGLSEGLGGDGIQMTDFTGVEWCWEDGSRNEASLHCNGEDTGSGMRIELDQNGYAAFEFAAPRTAGENQAHLLLRLDGKVEIIARQGKQEKIAFLSDGKTLGLAIIRYNGTLPLVLIARNAQKKRVVVRGFAAALSEPTDFQREIPRIPSLQEIALKQAQRLAPIDYIEKARAFGDCMLRYGQDRYGEVHSPLFSNILTRETEPRTTPYPLFAEKQPGAEKPTLFTRFDFNRVLNYPRGIGEEGPHKVTLYGCDPWEDRELYATLHEISRVTGDLKYRHAADEALNWWFKNTQSAETGLYPWGEHLGWDLEHDRPTYFEGPSKHLYAACYHEIKGEVPFLDYLILLPAKKPFAQTPLERYALGIWNAHFWDKEKAYFDRHGDYTGQDDRKGNKNGFPAHLGSYMEVWTSAYLNSKDAEFKRQIETVFHKALDTAVARTEKYGFFPSISVRN